MHSMLPWSVAGGRQKLQQRNWTTDSHIITDGSPDQNQVGAIFYTDRTDQLHAETFGNALLIMRAVNNHDMLVSSLYDVISAHDNLLVEIEPAQAYAVMHHAIDKARRKIAELK